MGPNVIMNIESSQLQCTTMAKTLWKALDPAQNMDHKVALPIFSFLVWEASTGIGIGAPGKAGISNWSSRVAPRF